MSNATIESPVAASQLYFAWCEQSEVGTEAQAAVKKSPAQRPKTPAKSQAALPSGAQATQHARQQQLALATEPSCAANSPQRSLPADSSTGYLTFTNDGRIARPVRIGSVMIKLLKRYGITDAEIAEGVASYARKHQQARAS